MQAMRPFIHECARSLCRQKKLEKEMSQHKDILMILNNTSLTGQRRQRNVNNTVQNTAQHRNTKFQKRTAFPPLLNSISCCNLHLGVQARFFSERRKVHK